MGFQLFVTISELGKEFLIVLVQPLIVEFGQAITVICAPTTRLAKTADKVLPVPVPLRFSTRLSCSNR